MPVIFCFKFERVNYPYLCGHNVISIYSYSISDMEIFLRQHAFDYDADMIDILDISDDSYDVSEHDILESYKLKSIDQDDRKVYNIITTRNLIENAVLSISYDISQTLYMGNAISYSNNISIIKLIQSLINKIPHVLLLDNPDLYEACLFNGSRDYLDTYINDPYDAKIYESLFRDMDDGILNITLEGYIQTFTDMIITRDIHILD